MRAALAATALSLALAPGLGGVAAAQSANPVGDLVRFAPGRSGFVGAWLLAGPFKSASNGQKPKTADALAAPPPGVDEARLSPALGSAVGATGVRWVIASSGEGPIDVKKTLAAQGSDLVAYAGGTLHLASAGRVRVLVGADDGVRLSVDGKVVLSRDESRPEHDDDDVATLDLPAGDHALLLKLHQREGGWALRVRIAAEDLAPPPGAFVALPGTTTADARALAARASWVSVDRGLGGDGYAPTLTVRLPEGAPLGVPLPVRARLVPARTPDATPLVDVTPGEVPLEKGELVVALPALMPRDLAFEDQDLAWRIDVAGREVKAPFSPRRFVREAVAHADRAIAQIEHTAPPPAWLAHGSLESVSYLRERLAKLVDHGDPDLDAERDEAHELDATAAALDKGVDPFASRTGPTRRAYRPHADGRLEEFALYVPPQYKPGAGRSWPLVVALHGLNGKPMEMIRWFFGGDDPKKDGDWEDRHVGALPPLDAFVVAPSGRGNSMYRDAGYDDVLAVLDEVIATYPINRARVTITGPSMGGIGTAACALRRPDLFAAAAPLCGYHSYFVRRDFVGKPIRPWERALAEERSNAEWAFNGEHVPLFIVHGTMDQPEANSGVLIEKYESLKYDVTHEHPNLGHNVWQTTYENFKGAHWLLTHHQDVHPAEIKFRTIRPRDGKSAWLSIEELASPTTWGEVEAHVKSRTAIAATTKGVLQLRFERDDKLVDRTASIAVTLDGTTLTFDVNEPLVAHKESGRWSRGEASHNGLFKRGAITGPLRDAFREPLLFVYGADDPAQARANEEVARAWARVRWGVDLDYPVISDAEFYARGEALANERSLFLVGNAKSNRVVRELEPELPVKIDGDAIVLGDGKQQQRFTGEQAGAAFVRPNPRRPSSYVVVVEGARSIGTLRSLSLPDLLPDFVVYDERVSRARGQVLLGAGSVLAAGFFENDWSLPATTSDPFAAASRPLPKTEHDATPYLP